MEVDVEIDGREKAVGEAGLSLRYLVLARGYVI
jgi:hypothetical protein